MCWARPCFERATVSQDPNPFKTGRYVLDFVCLFVYRRKKLVVGWLVLDDIVLLIRFSSSNVLSQSKSKSSDYIYIYLFIYAE